MPNLFSQPRRPFDSSHQSPLSLAPPHPLPLFRCSRRAGCTTVRWRLRHPTGTFATYRPPVPILETIPETVRHNNDKKKRETEWMGSVGCVCDFSGLFLSSGGEQKQVNFMLDAKQGDTICLGADGHGCGTVVQDHKARTKGGWRAGVLCHGSVCLYECVR